jgi:aryl sulfotransferase
VQINDARVDELARAATFHSMKSHADLFAPNTDIGIWRSNADFFRSGGTGNWQQYFDDELAARYEKRLGELAPADLAEWLHTGWLGYSDSAAVTSTSTS